MTFAYFCAFKNNLLWLLDRQGARAYNLIMHFWATAFSFTGMGSILHEHVPVQNSDQWNANALVVRQSMHQCIITFDQWDGFALLPLDNTTDQFYLDRANYCNGSVVMAQWI